MDDFFRHGMALNVAAALGVEELSVQCPWVAAERELPWRRGRRRRRGLAHGEARRSGAGYRVQVTRENG